jgi:hypothetical protein
MTHAKTDTTAQPKADTAIELQNSETAAPITFERHPDSYVHWNLKVESSVARLSMNVDPAGGLLGDYELKLNSYDIGVDIELADAIRRLRFEHPEVKVVVLDSAVEGVFCAGANIRMLAANLDCASSRRLTVLVLAVATRWQWPATTCCSSTIDRARCRSRKFRCSACCPVLAA